MQRMPAVSRPTWMLALSGFADRAGAPRRSPVEIVATMGSYLTRTQAAEVSGLRAGPFGRWADGVSAMREDCAAFARYWQAHNDRVLAEQEGSGPPPEAARPAGSSPPGSAHLDGPLWVVLGDSTAQGLGAPSPDGGYVGQVLAELRRTTGLPWRVLNLSVSGSLTRDVIGAQLPRLPAGADLVTCGIGVNDILYTSPAKLFADLRALIAAVPDQTVLLDLPLPAGCWGLLGRAGVPYVARINRTIHQAAAARGLPVAQVSTHFLPPWAGKFASDCFHPSQDGYRDWARALLTAVALPVPAPGLLPNRRDVHIKPHITGTLLHWAGSVEPRRERVCTTSRCCHSARYQGPGGRAIGGRPIYCHGSIPEDGSASAARAGLVVPRVGGMRALRLGGRLGGGLRRLQCLSLRRNLLRLRLRNRHRSLGLPRRSLGLPRRSLRLRPRLGRRRAGPGVVPQGRLDHLQAPLGLGPPGELGPRQHLCHPRGVVLGELQPDGDRI